MRYLSLSLVLIAGSLSAAADLVDLKTGLSEDFTRPDARERWSANPQAVVETEAPDNRVMRIDNKDLEKVVIYRSLRLDGLAGKVLELSARVKAAAVTEPVVEYKGVRLQLKIESPAGTKYAMVKSIFGTFNWQTLTCQAAIPADVTKIGIMLGMDGSTGTVWYDDLLVKVK